MVRETVLDKADHQVVTRILAAMVQNRGCGYGAHWTGGGVIFHCSSIDRKWRLYDREGVLQPAPYDTILEAIDAAVAQGLVESDP